MFKILKVLLKVLYEKKSVLSLKFPHASSVKILIRNFLLGVPAFVRPKQHDNINTEKFVLSLDP